MLFDPVVDTLALGFDLLPLPALVVRADGDALAANHAWRDFVGGQSPPWWAEVVHESERGELVDQIRHAAAAGLSGSGEAMVDTTAGLRASRWWWRPAEPGSVCVCIADIDDEIRARQDLWERATHDGLTGVVNRNEFLAVVDRVVSRAEEPDRTAVVYVDLDGFKEVNDRYGHAVGDEVLAAVARRLRHAVRPADVVARVGGDEFAVLCHEIDGPGEVKAIAGRIDDGLRQEVHVGSDTITISATTGLALARDRHESVDALIARADADMYASKWSKATSRHAPAAITHDVALEAAGRIINRIFEVGLILESTSTLVDHPAAERLHVAIEALDALVRDVRRDAFDLVVDQHRSPTDNP